MGWHLNGDWDALTTPPGATVNDLATIMSQIARAINERRYAQSGGATSFYYTDALDVTATYPTAAQFAGCKINGPCVRRFLSDCESIINSLTAFSAFYTDATYLDSYAPSEVWTTAGTGLAAFDITKSATYAPNWLRIKRALDLMLYCRVSGGFDVNVNLRVGESNPEATAADAWTGRFEATDVTTVLLDIDSYVLWKYVTQNGSDYNAGVRILIGSLATSVTFPVDGAVYLLRVSRQKEFVNPFTPPPANISPDGIVTIDGAEITGVWQNGIISPVWESIDKTPAPTSCELRPTWVDGDDGQPSGTTFTAIANATYYADLTGYLTDQS